MDVDSFHITDSLRMRNVQQTNGTATVSPETIRISQDGLGNNVTRIEDFSRDHPNMNWGGGGGDDPGPNFELIDDEKSSIQEQLREAYRQIKISAFAMIGLLPEASWEQLFSRGTEILSENPFRRKFRGFIFHHYFYSWDEL